MDAYALLKLGLNILNSRAKYYMVKDHLFLIQLVIQLLTGLSQGNPITLHTDASAVTMLQTAERRQAVPCEGTRQEQ